MSKYVSVVDRNSEQSTVLLVDSHHHEKKKRSPFIVTTHLCQLGCVQERFGTLSTKKKKES